MVEVIHSAFGARPPVDPPSTAIEETAETLAASLRRGSGIFAQVGGRPAGVIMVLPGGMASRAFSRVSVHPDLQRHGIASAMVAAAEELAAIQGFQAGRTLQPGLSFLSSSPSGSTEGSSWTVRFRTV